MEESTLTQRNSRAIIELRQWRCWGRLGHLALMDEDIFAGEHVVLRCSFDVAQSSDASFFVADIAEL